MDLRNGYIHVAVSCDVRTSREKNRQDCDPIEFVLLYLGISTNLHDNDEAKRPRSRRVFLKTSYIDAEDLFNRLYREDAHSKSAKVILSSRGRNQ